MYSLDIVFKNIREVISSVVIKYEAKGKALDTVETRRNYDMYKLALAGNTNYYLYDYFDKRALRYGGIPEEDIERCYNDKTNIPENLRASVIHFQEKIIVDEFEEKNNYYRTFLGLPDVEDKDFIYLDVGVAEELEIDYTTPIHLLTSDEIIRLENTGQMKLLKEKYKKPYLNHLGSNKIDIVTAREASNFSIIQMTIENTDNFYYDFHRIYGECREYFMSVCYIVENSSRYEYYDNFIALMIMVMTIQRMFVRTFKYGIDRDFYDVASIKLLFDSYNVPYLEEVPIAYQRTLMKNLNSLLKYKSSDKVLYDICDILGFGNIDILKFYLTKTHRLDDGGNPIFKYVEEMDPKTGQKVTKYDYETMFSFQWKTVELREKDIPSAILNSPLNESYETVVANDPFWVDDDNLRKKLYESEFNYIESKYLRMNLTYSLTSVIFDAIYALRMLADRKEKTSQILIRLPKLFNDRRIPLFNVVIFLTALLCKKNNLKGNIIVKPTQVLTVLGFNFKADFKQLKEYILENKRWIDPKVMDYFAKMDFSTAAEINNCYEALLEFYQFISDGIRMAKNKQTYDVHKKLYDTLMISQLSVDIYKKEDGTIAETYMDLLQDIDISLYAYAASVDKAAISEIIDHISFQIGALIDSFDFQYLNNDNNVILNALIKLIDFFKSYTTDLESFNIFYVSGDPMFNLIRLIPEINHIHKGNHERDRNEVFDKVKMVIKESSKRDLQILRDRLKEIASTIHHKDIFEYAEKYRYDTLMHLDDLIYYPFSDLIYLIDAELRFRDSVSLKDTLKIIYDIQN